MPEKFNPMERVLGREGTKANEQFVLLVKDYGMPAVLNYIESMTGGVAASIVTDLFKNLIIPSNIGIRNAIFNCLKNYREGDFETMGKKKLSPQTETPTPEAVKPPADLPKAKKKLKQAASEPLLISTEKIYTRLSMEQSEILDYLKNKFPNSPFTVRESGHNPKNILALYRAGYLTRRYKNNIPEYNIKKQNPEL